MLDRLDHTVVVYKDARFFSYTPIALLLLSGKYMNLFWMYEYLLDYRF
jgi:hypothetical protein